MRTEVLGSRVEVKFSVRAVSRVGWVSRVCGWVWF